MYICFPNITNLQTYKLLRLTNLQATNLQTNKNLNLTSLKDSSPPTKEGWEMNTGLKLLNFVRARK